MRMSRKRPAIAMIELIFSIVIMGLVLLSAPMLISTASKSTSVALQQEGINEAAARINMILTYEWDENNANAICAANPSILHVSGSGDNELDPARAGVPAASNSHTFDCGGAELNATAIGVEAGGIIDDQDDFADVHLKDVPLGTGGEDYIEQTTVDIATVVNYATDAATYNSSTPQFDFDPGNSAGTTNIKAITVTLTSSNGADELDKEITMRAFSCNIGSYRFDGRIMP